MKSEFAIREMRKSGELTILEIDTRKATYKGQPWNALSGFYKRKFENLIVLANPRERCKILYH